MGFIHIPHNLLVTFIILVLSFNSAAEWLNHGGDLSNRRYARDEFHIDPKTVKQLRLKWKFFAGKDISATPAVADGIVYFPSWNGYIYAVHALDGKLKWKQNLGQLTGLPGTGVYFNYSVARATPSVVGPLLIVGIYGPAIVIAVRRSTGSLVWLTRLDSNPLALITSSGTSFLDGYYVGVSSLEETLPAGQCCIFRGSMVKLNILTGAILWQTYTLPDNGGKLDGYSGAAIWGSSPAIDINRRLVYVATGNLYNAPPDVLACQERQNNQTSPPNEPDQCIGPGINFNSVLAFSMSTGRLRWAKQLGGYDVFYIICSQPNNPDCPPGPNVDADFGEAPMLLTINANGTRRRDVVVAVQKSGFVWALDRDNGTIIWSKLAGPGGFEGGGMWGAATDGVRVYTNIANSNRINFTLAPSNATTRDGVWVALDVNTGKILWTTANPSHDTTQGPVTVTAKGVVFAGSVASNGPFYAMDASTGQILWSNNTGATIYGGASVSHGCVYLGNGYTVGLAKFHPTWTPGDSLYAYCLF
ncbi:polyvinylalcohol dehydrogenase-like [Impatiens glandulifera]|uniref:polyvinylalcohol dehydrogenase-like n=1 Tax=Impatiens glandulifera TaxID=253017 RepID=UPI001FB10596|nr:polyvinylalcohol dehydrogenase-like [Impatiens glandulifera]